MHVVLLIYTFSGDYEYERNLNTGDDKFKAIIRDMEANGVALSEKHVTCILQRYYARKFCDLEIFLYPALIFTVRISEQGSSIENLLAIYKGMIKHKNIVPDMIMFNTYLVAFRFVVFFTLGSRKSW